MHPRSRQSQHYEGHASASVYKDRKDDVAIIEVKN